MNTHRTVLAIFAAAFVIAVVTAFFDDLAQCRHSQRQHGSSGHDRFGSTPSAVANACRPEIDRAFYRRL